MSIYYELSKDKIVRRELTFSTGEKLIIKRLSDDKCEFSIEPYKRNARINPKLIGVAKELDFHIKRDYRLENIVRGHFRIFGDLTGDRTYSLEELMEGRIV